MIPAAPSYSVIVPFFNEEEGITAFTEELHAATAVLSPEKAGTARSVCEVLLIDDGSTDQTGALLARACASRPGWRVIELERNCGQAAALYVGLRESTGDRLVLLDGDGQNEPAEIPRLLALLDGGADLAVGIRVTRQDSWQRRVMSRLANRVRQRFLRDGVRDAGCGLKVMRREVVEALVPLRTLYSFIPALAAGAGFSVAETPVSHRARRGGKSNYGVRRFLIWPLIDMLGVWWLNHRRCPPIRQVPSAANIIALPTPHLEAAWIKA